MSGSERQHISRTTAALSAVARVLLLLVLVVATTQAQVLTTLHEFRNTPDGAGPWAGLTRDRAGNLYGTTYEGGNFQACEYGCGTAFKLSPSASGWNYSLLHTFLGGVDGAFPVGAVVLDTQGNIYGTSDGGGRGYGAVWEITP